jgi:hypothetical protein
MVELVDSVQGLLSSMTGAKHQMDAVLEQHNVSQTQTNTLPPCSCSSYRPVFISIVIIIILIATFKMQQELMLAKQTSVIQVLDVFVLNHSANQAGSQGCVADAVVVL